MVKKLQLDLRMQIVSDLHIEFFGSLDRVPNDIIIPAAPVLALLGDIGVARTSLLRSFLHQQAERFEHVLFVPGNHEFYNISAEMQTTVGEQMAWMRQVCDERDNVHLLERQGVEINSILFLGTTLWSHVPPEKAAVAEHSMNDYRLCFVVDKRGNRRIQMTTQHTNQWHKECVQWLQRKISQASACSQPVVVLTHHTPTMEGTSSPSDTGGTVQCCFSTDLRHLLRPPVRVWACGHTHFNFDHILSIKTPGKGVRLLSNQRGYRGKDKMDYDPAGIVVRVSPTV